MKKRLFFLLFVFISFPYHSSYAQPDNTALGDVQVSNPQVASLSKYMETSNNPFTGAVNLSIPIETLEEGPLVLPISVNYFGGGIRTGASASRCGMGFSLTATGVLSRVVLGIQDEGTNGYLQTNWDYYNPAVLENINLADYDGEPDLFSYSLPTGVSGKFIINKSINDVVQYPRTDNKIVISGIDLEEFIVITPDGTKYFFGQSGNENFDGFIQVGDIPNAFAASVRRQHTEWYLRKMVSQDDNFEINFTYTPKEYALLSPASEHYSKVFSNRQTADPGFLQADQGFSIGGESLGAFTVLAAGVRTQHQLYASIQVFEAKELARITTSTTQVDFIEGTSKRQDLDTAPYSESDIALNLSRPEYQMYPLSQIKVQNIGGNVFCKQFNFSYDYFKAFAAPTYSFDVRLKLNSIQEVTCNGTGESVPPYIFDYYTLDNLTYDYLPWRLTKGRDAYGFSNGEDAFNNNQEFTIPPTTLSATHGSSTVTLTHGTARRQTEFIPMRSGALKSVKFPEKGISEYIYAANSIKKVDYDTMEVNLDIPVPTIQSCPISATICCDPEVRTASHVYNFSQAFIDSAIIKIWLQNVGCMNEPGVPYEGGVLFEVMEETSGNRVGVLKSLNSSRLFDSLTIDLKANYPGILAGNNYEFKITVTNARGVLFFKKKRITQTVSDELVGGLRLKEQHSYDRHTTLLTSRFYDYSYPNEAGVSSGVVYKKPYFGQVISGGDITAQSGGVTINNFFVKFAWNSTPILSLTDIQGYHIGYQNIRSYQSNGAFTDYVFKTKSLDSELGTTLLPYPIAPLQYFYDNGKLLQQKQGGGHGGTEYIVQQKGNSAVPRQEVINQNLAVRLEAQSGDGGQLFLANHFNWQPTGFYELLRDTTMIDGVETILFYDYAAAAPRDHLQPTEITMTNSDGQVYTDKIRYAHEVKNDGDLANQAVYQEMIDRNMIGIPIEQTREVDGALVSGSRTQFNLFFDDPYLEEIYQYETTWDTLGNEVTTGWELFGKVLEYYDFGKPKRIQRKNWLAMSLEYHPVHRLPTQRKFLDYRWNYEYYDGSRLMAKITDIDRQFVVYEWDGLARLDSIKERLGAVKTGFTYKYAGQDVSRPQTYVKQQTVYTPVDGSALQSQTVWRYFDDISRPFQTVKQSYSGDNGFDVVSTTEFDAYSRPFKQYEDFEIANTDGFSVAVPASTPFTLNTYEETPLNRSLTITPPNWHTTSFEYGHNTVADGVLNLETGMAYAEGLLNKEVVIDPNDHKSILFKDKRSRPVLSRKEGQTATDQADTYSLFDAKERPSIVVPPGATLTTPNLLFKTFYDGANNPILKKIPDMQVMEMLYNNRDLMVAKQGGNLRADDKWMITTYDDYPRVQQTGLVTQAGKPDPNTVVPTEIWTEAFYGGFKTTDFLDSLGIDASNFAINVNADYLIGKLTTTRNRVLNGNSLTGQSILRVMDYNQYGQMILEVGRNHYPNSVLNKTFTYDFADNLLTQSRAFYTTDSNRLHRDTLSNTYDHQARLIDSYHSINNQGRQHISQLEYTAKDEVKTKFLGGTLSGFLQEVNYEYLDNGFLSGINSTMSTTDLFQLNINYDQAVANLTGAAQKNGNISQLTWKVQGKTEQTYGYSYDFLDRIKTANYGVYSTPARTSLVIGNEYSTTYGYDPRGNFTNITRNGVYSDGTTFSSQQIDNMSFTPIAGTNKIEKITDTAPCPDKKAIHQALDNTELHATNQTIEADNPINLGADVTYQAGTSVTLKAGFHAEGGTTFTAKIDGCGSSGTYETGGFVQRSTADMEYDAEGNMTKDPNKGIDILFDYNNRPYKVTWANGNTVEWLYDGAGTKLQKIVKRNGITAPLYKQDYFDGIEFRNDTLEAIYLSDAKITHDDSNFDYIYYGKDHLQNSRVLFKNNGGVAQLVSEHHFYPFGMRMEGNFSQNAGRENKYLFGGKELQDDFGLNTYDYITRQYDPAIGRFWQIDNLADNFTSWSPYSFGFNNPIRFIDPDGQAPEDIILGGNSKQQNRAFNHLQSLTNDRLGFIPSTGEVFVKKSNSVNSSKRLTQGSALVKELINSEKVVTIEISKSNGTNPVDANGVQTSTAEENTRNGEGTSSNVRFAPDNKGNLVRNEDGTTGRPANVGLAHELVHARNNANGVNKNQETTNMIDPDDTSGTRTVSREEVNVRREENVIRNELGVKPRAVLKSN